MTKRTLDRRQEFIDWINKTFRPENTKYPVALKVENEYLLTSDSAAIWPESLPEDPITLPVIDYYGEFRGGYPWIEPRIMAKAKEMGICLEWYDPGSVSMYEE